MAPTHPQRPAARYPIATNVRIARHFLAVALVEREARIVERRAQGFTWAEIADQEHLSIRRAKEIWRAATHKEGDNG